MSHSTISEGVIILLDLLLHYLVAPTQYMVSHSLLLLSSSELRALRRELVKHWRRREQAFALGCHSVVGCREAVLYVRKGGL